MYVQYISRIPMIAPINTANKSFALAIYTPHLQQCASLKNMGSYRYSAVNGYLSDLRNSLEVIMFTSGLVFLISSNVKRSVFAESEAHASLMMVTLMSLS